MKSFKKKRVYLALRIILGLRGDELGDWFELHELLLFELVVELTSRDVGMTLCCWLVWYWFDDATKRIDCGIIWDISCCGVVLLTVCLGVLLLLLFKLAHSWAIVAAVFDDVLAELTTILGLVVLFSVVTTGFGWFVFELFSIRL